MNVCFFQNLLRPSQKGIVCVYHSPCFACEKRLSGISTTGQTNVDSDTDAKPLETTSQAKDSARNLVVCIMNNRFLRSNI